MERNQTLSIGEVLRAALESTEADRMLRERQAIAVWPAVVGPGIASLASRPTVSAGIMTVRIASAALRHDLMMNRSAIIRDINARLSQPAITDIRFAAPGG